MENTDAQAAALWQSFSTLTQEMYRFIKKGEIDMFLNLLNQRLDLQKKLEQLNNTTYHKTEEGHKLIASLNPLNIKIHALAQTWLISHKNHSNKVHAYDAMKTAGNFFNKKF